VVYLIEIEENGTKDLFVEVLQKLPIIKQKELLRYRDIADTRSFLYNLNIGNSKKEG